MRIILFSTLLLISVSSIAQTGSGNIMLGGTASLLFKTGTPSGHSYNLSPNAGYFVIDNLALGASIDLRQNYSKMESLGKESRDKSGSFAPFIRYYYGLSDKLSIFGYGAYGFGRNKGWYKNKTGNNLYVETEAENKLNTGDLGIGLTYFVNQHIGLEGTFGWSHYQVDGSDAYNTIGFEFGFQIFLP